MWRRDWGSRKPGTATGRATARTGTIITHALRRWGLGLDRCCHCVQLIKTKPRLPFSLGGRSGFVFLLFSSVAEWSVFCVCAAAAAAER
jgi:hypothetical protein